MSNVWCIWSSSSDNGRKNLRHGLLTKTWGLKNEPHGGSPAVGDYVLFGMEISGPNARLQAVDWVGQSASLLLGEVNSPVYRGLSWHWDDEQSQRQVVYPHRFGFLPLGRASNVSLSVNGPLGPDISEALRLSVSRNRAVLGVGDVGALLQLMDVRSATGSLQGTPDASLDSTLPPPEAADEPANSSRPGRMSDPVLRTIVEKHAVAQAEEHMRVQHGWSNVRELGKPFDLVCTGHLGEKHVEVKGTTGAGGSVEYTSNEVHHFRTCPYGADLIVVREIQLDFANDPPTASGGTLLHVPDYLAPSADLQPTRFNGRVRGW